MPDSVATTQLAATGERAPAGEHYDKGCCFCAELANERTEVQDVYPQLCSRLVLETESFVAMPSLGQLAPGHLLLVPREHVTSFGELRADARHEAEDLYHRIRSALSRRFSPVVSFEHGSPPGARSGGCGIFHAHIHFVPVGRRTADPPCSIGEGWTPSRGSWFDEATTLADRGQGYLMWHGRTDPAYVEAAHIVPSQYLRRHVAGLLGAPGWDWRTAGRQPDFIALTRQSSRWGKDTAII